MLDGRAHNRPARLHQPAKQLLRRRLVDIRRQAHRMLDIWVFEDLGQAGFAGAAGHHGVAGDEVVDVVCVVVGRVLGRELRRGGLEVGADEEVLHVFPAGGFEAVGHGRSESVFLGVVECRFENVGASGGSDCITIK